MAKTAAIFREVSAHERIARNITLAAETPGENALCMQFHRDEFLVIVRNERSGPRSCVCVCMSFIKSVSESHNCSIQNLLCVALAHTRKCVRLLGIACAFNEAI